jgi:hypothetical protein
MGPKAKVLERFVWCEKALALREREGGVGVARVRVWFVSLDQRLFIDYDPSDPQLPSPLPPSALSLLSKM